MDTTQMAPGEEVFVDDEIIHVGIQDTNHGACVKYTLAGEDNGEKRAIWENLENPANARITMDRLLELGFIRKADGEIEVDEDGEIRTYNMDRPVSIPNQHISIARKLYQGKLINSINFRLRGHNTQAAKRGLKIGAQYLSDDAPIAKAAAKMPSRQKK